MIGKLVRGRSMRGLLDYLLAQNDQKGDERPRVKIIGGTFAGHTPRLIASEFAALRALKPRLNVAVVHETLRLPPTASEPTDAEWLAIAKYWAGEMGFDAWVAVSHGDGHIHLACSRILVNGDVIKDSNDWTKSESIVRRIESQFGLDNIEPSHLLNPDRDWVQRAPTRQQLAVIERTGAVPPSQIVASVIDTMLSKGTSLRAFLSGLNAAGIDVRPNISATTGRMSGFAYRVGDILVTAKAMGRSYTFSALQERGLIYDAEDDARFLQYAQTESFERERRAAMDSAAAIAIDAVAKLPVAASKPVGGSAILTAESMSHFVTAVGCEQFAVHFERQTDGASSKIYKLSAAGLLSETILEKLRKSNRDRLNVHIAPIDRRVVALSNVSEHGLKNMHEEGFAPTVVTMPSPRSFDVWVRLLPATAPEPSPVVSEQAARVLRQRYSEKPNNDRAGLAPGFVNRDPLQKVRKRYPWISITERAQSVATNGAELLRRITVILSEWARLAGRLGKPEDLSSREFFIKAVGNPSSTSTQMTRDGIAVKAMKTFRHDRDTTCELVATLSPDIDAIIRGAVYSSRIVEEAYINQVEADVENVPNPTPEIDGP